MSRMKIDMPDRYIFSTTIPIRISDINYGDHLANDALLSIINEARVQFLGGMGYAELDIEGAGIIMSDVAISYKSQAYYGDTLTIEIAINGFSRTGCDFYYRVKKDNGEIVALCKTGIMFFDYTGNKLVSIPSKFISSIKAE